MRRLCLAVEAWMADESWLLEITKVGLVMTLLLLSFSVPFVWVLDQVRATPCADVRRYREGA